MGQWRARPFGAVPVRFGCCSLLRNAVAVMALLFSAPRRFEFTVHPLGAYAAVYALELHHASMLPYREGVCAPEISVYNI